MCIVTTIIEGCRGRRVALMTKERRPQVSVAGLLGVLPFPAGRGTTLFNLAAGVLLMAVALLLGDFERGASTVTVCPRRGTEGRWIR